MLLRSSTTLLSLLLACSLGAADSADVETAVRELHKEAKAGSDLWLCLQLEAYADRIDLRLPSILGRGGAVHGQPLLSYPDRIVAHFDRGSYCLVVAGNRVQRVAPDGRPLDGGNWLPFEAEVADLSPDGRFLAVARLDGPDTQKTAQVAVLEFKRGNRARFHQRRALGGTILPAEDRLDQVRVAADGSAAALVIRRDKLIPEPRNAVVATATGTTIVPTVHHVDVLGPAGAWMLGRTPDGRDGCYVGSGLTAPARIGFDRSAGGGGIAAMRNPEGDGVLLVGADGTVSEWTPTGAPGDVRALYGVGEWLALRTSGSVEETPLSAAPAASVGDVPPASADSADLFAAQTPAPPTTEEPGAVDLFAAPPDPAAPAPPSSGDPQATLLYRWSDLAKDPAAAPAYRLNGACSVGQGHAMSLVLWHGKQLDLVELGGEVPQRRPFTTATDDIDEVWFSEHHYVMTMNDGAVTIIDQLGTELGRYPHQADVRTDVRSRGAALRYRYDETDAVVDPVVVVLSPDPDQRREIPLADWPEDMRAGHAHIADDVSEIVVAHGVRWMRFDPATGAVTGRDQPDGSAPRPDVRHVQPASGRFYTDPHSIHLIPVAGATADPERPMWAVADASLIGRTLLVLDRDGAIHAIGRGGWQEVARLPGAARFVAVRGDKGIFLGYDHRSANAELRPGRGLETIDPPLDADEPDHGSWQVRGTLFTVPGKAQTQIWDRRATRMRPWRLQGIERNTLLALCPGVVLQLDAGTAAAFGADFDREERLRANRDRR